MGIYHRPGKLKDALAVLARSDVQLVAGCTDVFAASEAQELCGSVLDITQIAELRGISKTGTGWRIGAATTWRDVCDAPLPAAFDMLKQAAREVGGIQVQNAGTVAGNICNASPAADGMPPLLALDAQVELVSERGVRQVPLAQFVTGPREISREKDEVVTSVLIPEASAVGRSRFLKLGARKHLVISIAMTAVLLEVEAKVIKAAAVSVGACGPVACRVSALENVLVGCELSSAVQLVQSDKFGDVLSPISDVRGDADYRRDAAVELVRRAVHDVIEEIP
ncbi:FAD binding domain-containing protein [Shimia sagamensis]|uniref:CO or xanthine dehydrogenase, FAD-binding subunit n=1 Tax=Shimia sagamensis TaxID=1566352 RepID=A0ABY1NHX4_9RHOB|nr:FAD binding domain-containing protein [Shimia sagamensis]SMP10154.1 CO or xanthine dehydrogenase, FAD-binding subunit [Shimia sagamensis]